MILNVSPEIDARGLRLRLQPGLNGGIVTILQAGERLETLEADNVVRARLGRKEQWLQVKDSQGQSGYCAAWLLQEPVSTPRPPSTSPAELQVKVSGQIGRNDLRLRLQPEAAASTLASEMPGTLLTVLEPRSSGLPKVGVNGQWLHVQDPQGRQGYVFAQHVEAYQPPAASSMPDPKTDPNSELISLPEVTVSQAETHLPVEPAAPVMKPEAEVQSAPALEPIPQPVVSTAPVLVRVASSVGSRGLRLRSKPSLAGAVLEVMPAGTLLEILEPLNTALPKVGVVNQWLNVKDNSGSQGYTAAWFVEAVSPLPPQIPNSTPPGTSTPQSPTTAAAQATHLVYDVPMLAQDNLYGNAACSPVSACMLLEYYHKLDGLNRAVTPQQLIAMLDPGDGTPGKGMSLSNVTDELQSLGYIHISQKLYASLADLKTELINGPLIVTVGVKLVGPGTLSSSLGRAIQGPGNTSHAMVVKGFSPDTILVNDPWTGKELRFANQIFESMWKPGLNGMYIIRP
jgi:uncharacterized protein YvpB